MNGNVKFGPDTEWLSPPPPPSGGSTPLPRTYGADFWQNQLAAVLSDSHLAQIHQSITSYLPGVTLEGLSPDYAGIRPKLIPPTRKSFMDFTLLWHWSRGLEAQKLWSYANLPAEFQGAYSSSGKDGLDRPYTLASRDGNGGAMLTLAGIESPGLTSCLAIGEMVVDTVSEQVWGHGDATRKRQVARQREREQRSEEQAQERRSRSAGFTASAAKTIPKGARNEEIGGASLDAWA